MFYETLFGERPTGMPPAKCFVVVLCVPNGGDVQTIEGAIDYLDQWLDPDSEIIVRPLSEGIPC